MYKRQVLGGLVDDSLDESRRGVPVLSSIPLLGGLFRSSSASSTKRNLMVFLSPHILRSATQADYYTQKKYQQLELLAPRQAAFLRDSLEVKSDLSKAGLHPAEPTSERMMGVVTSGEAKIAIDSITSGDLMPSAESATPSGSGAGPALLSPAALPSPSSVVGPP